jgi:hypothetical protein
VGNGATVESSILRRNESTRFAIRGGEGMGAADREPMPKGGTTDILPLVIGDLQTRDQAGTKKYGTTLQTNNGRDPLIDAYQECLDMAMYLRQAIEERAKP